MRFRRYLTSGWVVVTLAASATLVIAQSRSGQRDAAGTVEIVPATPVVEPARALDERPPPPARTPDPPTRPPADGPATQPGGASPTAAEPSGLRTLRPEDFKGLAWRCIGPANMGGRVADIAIAPGNSKTFYVGFGTSGLFKTDNRGTTLTPVFDKEGTASIGAVAVCDAPENWKGWADDKEPPQSPQKSRAERGKARIVWVGTGEANGRNSSSWGCGVYRSTDGGATFEHLGLAETHDIPRLAVDPRDPDVCYVAAIGKLWGPNPQRGVFKTSDGGKTWRHVLKIDDDTGAIDVMIDPSNPDTVFAAMYHRRRQAWSFRSGGPEGGVYRSRDGGANWVKLTGGLPKQTGRIGLEIYAKNPRILYAVIESDEGGWGAEIWDDRLKSGGVFRSEDGGDSWTRVSSLNFRPFYFSKVKVDPNDDQRVYLLGWGMGVSDDGGRTFRADGARVPHGDLHALVIDPADTDHLLLGTDGGVYLSYDRGKTWDFINSVAVGEFYNINVDMSDPYRVAGGLQDNGSWFGPSATLFDTGPEDPAGAAGITNGDWQVFNWGDGFHVAFDPQDPNILYGESQGGVLVRANIATGRRKRIHPSAKEGQPRYRFNWNSPFFVSSHQPTTLYLGGNHVFRLLDRGERWEQISPDLSTRDAEKITTVGSEAETHGTVVSLAESPLAAGMLWAGSDDGLVHLTRDDGRSWSNVTPPQVEGRYISKIEASRHDRETAYVAIDGHRSNDFVPRLVMTTDAGRTWTSVAGDLPTGLSGDVVKCVREDVVNRDVLYVGTERSAFVTIDRGRHWVRLNADTLPTVAVDDLVLHPRERDLVAGTHGRSIWILDDVSCLSQLTPAVVQSEFHLFEPMPGKPRLRMDYGGLWGHRIFRGKNPPMGARLTYWIRDYTGDEVKLTISDARGQAVCELKGTNRPGINRVVWDLQPEKHARFRTPDSEWLGQLQFVPAGEYTVNASYGKRTATTKVRVLQAPGE